MTEEQEILASNSILPKADKKLWLFVIVIVYFATVLYGQLIRHNNFMLFLGLPVMTPSFADLRVITTGLDAYRAGYDPIPQNPFDPWLRPMNYPRIWLALAWTGMGGKHTEIIGIFLAFAFCCSLYLVIPRINSFYEFFVYALLILSPAMLLGVERGNNDLIVFVLLSIAVTCFLRKKWLFYSTILFCSIIKLYPILALAAGLKEHRKVFVRILVVFGLIFGLYLFGTRENIETIYNITPRSTHFSYGNRVLFQELVYSFGPNFMNFPVLFFTASSISLALLVSKYSKWDQLENGTHMTSFRVGAGIFLGTFLIGNNYDYRLMHLLFCVPQLLEWCRAGGAAKQASVLTLVTMILSFWSMFFERNFPVGFSWSGGCVIEEILNWFLFFIFSGLFLKSSRFFKKREGLRS